MSGDPTQTHGWSPQAHRGPGGATDLPTPKELNYLAKDYTAFRRMMLDHLAAVSPQWRPDDLAADPGVALVEVLAYAADQLSYYQDAVGTEAYLATARLRSSVRRHLQLIDATLDEGCNSRLWVRLEVSGRGVLPAGTLLLSGVGADAQQPRDDTEPFETLTAARLDEAANALQLAGSGPQQLAEGATSAELAGDGGGLRSGDLLLIEATDPNFSHIDGPLFSSGVSLSEPGVRRHVVRLCADPVPTGASAVTVRWHDADALPWAMTHAPDADDPLLVSIFGNLVLASHGRTVRVDGLQMDRQVLAPAGRLHLPIPPPVRAPARDTNASARFQPAFAAVDPAQSDLPAHAQVVLVSTAATGAVTHWHPVASLIGQDPDAACFVVELEADGSAHARFGSGVEGRTPDCLAHWQLEARVGGGARGLLGPETPLVVAADDATGALVVRQAYNPLPATGGREPESVASAKLRGPESAHDDPRLTCSDEIVAAARGLPYVASASARALRLPTGTVFRVCLTPAQGAPPAAEVHAAVRAALAPRCLTGTRLHVTGPDAVAIAIRLKVWMAPGSHDRNNPAATVRRVKAAVLGTDAVDAAVDLPCGEDVHLSRMLARLKTAVPGVVDAQAVRFRRARGDAADVVQSIAIPVDAQATLAPRDFSVEVVASAPRSASSWGQGGHR